MKKRLTVFLTLTLACLSASAKDWYVSTTGNNAGEGTIVQPFATIAKAIQSATDNDAIYVAGGTYADTWGSASKTLNISGSWNDDFSAQPQLDGAKAWEFSNPTVVSVKGVIYSVGSNKGGLIDGFTFSHPSIPTGTTTLAIRNTSVKRCAFKDNAFVGDGGNNLLSTYINNSTITPPLIENCLFDNNDLFWGNSNIITAGTNSTIQVRNCVFSRNKNATRMISGLNGGASQGGQVVNCIFFNNEKVRTAMIDGNANTEIVNCLIYNNSYTTTNTSLVSTSGLVVNCTLVNNTIPDNAKGATGLALTAGGKIYNSIILGNTKNGTTPIGITGNVAAEVKNCAFDGDDLGANVEEVDNKVFSGSQGVGFHSPSAFSGADASKMDELSACNWALFQLSPLKDVGKNDFFTQTAYGAANRLDLSGGERIFNNIIDLGAYENRSTLSDKEAALPMMVDYFKKNGHRRYTLDSDLTADQAKAQLAADGHFEDMRSDYATIASIIGSTNQTNQTRVINYINQALHRLWAIADTYRNKDLSATDFPTIRDKFWKSIALYTPLEFGRPAHQGWAYLRWHASCFIFPTAAINVYFSLLDDAENIEKGANGYALYADALSNLKQLGYQSWSMPKRGNETDANPVQVARFQGDSWWVGANALTYRSVLPAAAMMRSVPMFDVISEVAQRGLSVTSQNTFEETFWTEGFTADGAGWGHGMQNIIWGYPSQGTTAAVDILLTLKGTPWSKSLTNDNAQSILNFFRGGAWYYHNRYIPPCLDRNSMLYSSIKQEVIPYKNLLTNIKNAYLDSYPSEEQQEISKLYTEVMGAGDIAMSDQPSGRYTGTRWFYNNDDLIKKNASYYWLVNMASSRCDGLESDNQTADNYNIFTCDGMTLLQRRGDEYRRAFGASVLTALPGITARQSESSLATIQNWRGYTSKHNWAAGATRNENAVAGFVFEKLNGENRTGGGTEKNPKALGVLAYKGYFMQGDYLICLGSGITNKNTSYPETIYTTLDQTLRSGTVTVASSGSSTSYTTAQTLSQTLDASTWVAQEGGFAYKLLAPYTTSMMVKGENRPTKWNNLNVGNAKVSNKSENENILQLSIDHGQAANNATYAYTVYGGNKSASELVSTSLPFEIVSNTKTLQAVRSTDNRLVQALFYTADAPLQWGNHTLSVSSPCAIQIDESTDSYFFTLSEATMSKTLTDIEITTSLPIVGTSLSGDLRKVTVPLPQKENASASTTIEVAKNSPVNIENNTVSTVVFTFARQADGLLLSAHEPTRIQIFNLAGQPLFDELLSGSRQLELPKGVFVITGTSDKGAQTVKVGI